jgi:hypothetical protein
MCGAGSSPWKCRSAFDARWQRGRLSASTECDGGVVSVVRLDSIPAGAPLPNGLGRFILKL